MSHHYAHLKDVKALENIWKTLNSQTLFLHFHNKADGKHFGKKTAFFGKLVVFLVFTVFFFQYYTDKNALKDKTTKNKNLTIKALGEAIKKINEIRIFRLQK